MTDFSITRAAFQIPAGQCYLDGATFGLMPKAAPAQVQAAMTGLWAEATNPLRCDTVWHALPDRIAARIARLIGADPADLLIGESLSIQVFQALSSALSLCSGAPRRIILTDNSIAQSDLLVLQAHARTLGCALRVVEPEQICYALADDVAVLLMAEVDRRTGKRRDLPCLTRLAHEAGALTVWDLSHSIGATAINLTAACADFAIGATHKYLNGGPGAPAFIWIAPRFADRIEPALQGGMGRQGFCGPSPAQAAASGIERLRIGTVSLPGLAALDAAMEVWDGVDPAAIYHQSGILTAALIEGVADRCPELMIATPREAAGRGSHVSLNHPAAGAIAQALEAEDIIVGHCPPNILRIAFAPFYNNLGEVGRVVDALDRAMKVRPPGPS